jgi:hypothetical protein
MMMMMMTRTDAEMSDLYDTDFHEWAETQNPLRNTRSRSIPRQGAARRLGKKEPAR